MSSLIKDKTFQTMIEYLENKIGSDETGLFVSILCDSLDNLTEGVSERNIRTIEIIYNDFYSTKFDFDKGEYVKDGKE